MRPILFLYKYENRQFKNIAAIDDYEECSWETRLYEAGVFTIQINFNIPNADLFRKGLFVQFGNDPYKFGEISEESDSIGSAGKGSQVKVVTGYDARYIFHRRIIRDLNTVDSYMTAGCGEICMRRLVDSQCGIPAEESRRLPVTNIIGETGVGGDYVVNEAYTNLYDALVTVATQTQVGWRVMFNGSLSLDFYDGTNRSAYIRFNANMQTLDSGTFTDSMNEYANAVYIGGKGSGSDRDIYEAMETGAEGLDRFEAWIDKPDLTNESEYATEAENILRQYSQTVSLVGKGLAKSPYVFDKDYFVGDIVQFSFSGRKADVRILSVSEHYAKGEYDIDFEVGKPLADLSRQLSLLLKKIQSASAAAASKSSSSIRWYDIPVDRAMKSDEVTYDVIGFYDNAGTGETFQLYFNADGTGSKIYHVYLRQLAGSGKLTLTTGVGQSIQLDTGTYVTIIYVDKDGNISTIA